MDGKPGIVGLDWYGIWFGLKLFALVWIDMVASGVRFGLNRFGLIWYGD